MSLLLRVAFVWIILGFVLGIVLRRQLRRRSPLLIFGLSLFPALGHFIYIAFYTLRNTGDLGLQLGVFGLLAALVVTLIVWGGGRYLRGKPSRTALLPLGVSLAYTLPLMWFSSALRAQQIGLDAIPSVVLAAATLFASSTLFSYLWRFEPGTLLRRRR